MLLFICRHLHADGGVLIAKSKHETLSAMLFATPVPARVGTLDLSVLLQNNQSKAVELDCRVELEMLPPGETMGQKNHEHHHHHHTGAKAIKVEATHNDATNKMLYHKLVRIKKPGKWHLMVHATCPQHASTLHIHTNISIGPKLHVVSMYWPYFTWPWVLLLLYGFNVFMEKSKK